MTVPGGLGEPDKATGIDDAGVHGELARSVDRHLVDEAESGFNGSVLVARNGVIVLHKGYGWADEEYGEPVTVTTPFWIASVSKQFAAAAILALEERGQLSLQDSIAKYLPDAPEDKRAITIHQLLTHTSGLQQNYAADGITDRDTAMRAIWAQPLARAPGEGYGYSNDAYNLIAAIVEISSHRTYESYVRDELLSPAGLTQTGFWGPADHRQVAAIRDYQFPDSSIVRPNWGFRGAVGMYSTAGDLYRWYLALKDGSVLSKASARRLTTPHLTRGATNSTGVGYGWFVSPTPRGTTSIWTRGYEGFGHGAVLASYPQERVVIAITTNSGADTSGVPVSHRLSSELAELICEPQR
jgi:CubicO group peptidase (beta-lactamase class C family)